MSYEDNIPEFALRPAKEPEETGDGFDPTPYDRLLYGEEKDTSPSAEEYESGGCGSFRGSSGRRL